MQNPYPAGTIRRPLVDRQFGPWRRVARCTTCGEPIEVPPWSAYLVPNEGQDGTGRYPTPPRYHYTPACDPVAAKLARAANQSERRRSPETGTMTRQTRQQTEEQEKLLRALEAQSQNHAPRRRGERW